MLRRRAKSGCSRVPVCMMQEHVSCLWVGLVRGSAPVYSGHGPCDMCVGPSSCHDGAAAATKRTRDGCAQHEQTGRERRARATRPTPDAATRLSRVTRVFLLSSLISFSFGERRDEVSILKPRQMVPRAEQLRTLRGVRQSPRHTRHKNEEERHSEVPHTRSRAPSAVGCVHGL